MSGVLTKLREVSGQVTPSEQRVCDYILESPDFVMNNALNVVAKACAVSDATIIRLCRKIDLSGYHELRIALAREDASTSGGLEVIHEDVQLSDSNEVVLKKVFNAFGNALVDTLQVADLDQFSGAAEALLKAKSVSFFGFGASAAVAFGAHFRFMRLGIPVYVLTDASAQLSRVAMLGEGDVVVAISHSGRTKELVYSAECARERGAVVVSVTQYGITPLSQLADYTLHTASVETAFRSEAMVSHVAQQALLDALFVAVSLPNSERVIAAIEENHRLIESLHQIY